MDLPRRGPWGRFLVDALRGTSVQPLSLTGLKKNGPALVIRQPEADWAGGELSQPSPSTKLARDRPSIEGITLINMQDGEWEKASDQGSISSRVHR
jgi:hypothetical protein